MLTMPLQIGTSLQTSTAGAIEFLPRLIGAIVILIIGWIVGRIVGGFISRSISHLGVDERMADTTVGRFLGGTEGAVSHTLGRIGAWFVYALPILAAADVLAISVLSAWIAEALAYLPALIAGVLIILIGFVLADWFADVIGRTETVTDTGYTEYFADGIRAFLYFIVLTIGLATMGIDVQILYIFATAAAWGLAAGAALAIGISFGWGGKDYVHDHIAGWVGRSGEITPSSSGGTATGDDA